MDPTVLQSPSSCSRRLCREGRLGEEDVQKAGLQAAQLAVWMGTLA